MSLRPAPVSDASRPLARLISRKMCEFQTMLQRAEGAQCWRLSCACPGCPFQPNTRIACRGNRSNRSDLLGADAVGLQARKTQSDWPALYMVHGQMCLWARSSAWSIAACTSADVSSWNDYL